MREKKIIWIGPYLTKEQLNQAVMKGYKQVAATLSQQYFVDGIEKSNGENIDIISAIRPPAFPTYKEIFIKGEKFSHSDSAEDTSIGFLNIKYINHLLRERALIRAANQWAKNNDELNVEIIVYSLHSPFLRAALEIKKLITSAKITVIVPDLPLNMDMSSITQRTLKKIDWMSIKKMLGNIDKFILFTSHMADYLGLNKKQWIVIEGLIDEKKLHDNIDNEKSEKNVCLYMGTLKKEYKIDTFTKAFINANIPNTELHIYGNGDYKNELIKICEKHKNVKYCGFVSSDEAFDLMKKATLLVNPRPTNYDYTKYSCPSKTFEYMASGSPLVTTKLAGIPEEYFEYTYCFSDESIEGMSKTLKNILIKEKEELNKKGESARNFIKNNKNNIVQCAKIMEFINK